MNETLTTLKTRRSIRRYRPEQVRPETLDTILEAGTYAPSGMGKQSAVMVVVQKPDTIALLSRLNAEIQGRPGTDPFYGAPTVVVVLADGENYNWMRDGALVMGNLMNAAWSLGGRLLLDQPGAGAVRPPGGQGAAGPLGASGHPSRRGQLYPGLSGGGRPYPQAPEAGLHRPGLSAAGSGPF